MSNMGEEEVVSSYLRSKLSSILQEAESDSSSPSRIISRFRSIERQIESDTNKASQIPVAHLYDLIEALSECRVFSYQRRTPRVSNNPFHFNFHPLSEFMFKRRMRKRLDAIERKLETPSPGDSRPPAGLVIQQTYPILDPSPIIGFGEQAEKIEAWLTASRKEEEEEEGHAFRAVGIVGRCGCGKTALAQKVFASPKIEEEFWPRIWVCLSNMLLDNKRVDPRVRVVNYILEEIRHDVAELEYPAYSLVKLLEKLQRGLMGKRYLIVLDDAWRVDEWYAGLDYRLPRDSETADFLSHGLPKGSGGAVIVTSRRENVIERMVGNKHVIRLEPHLSDEICWQIFLKVLEQQPHHLKMDSTHPKLCTIEDDVKRNFDGLPLAAKALANILPDLLLARSNDNTSPISIR